MIFQELPRTSVRPLLVALAVSLLLHLVLLDASLWAPRGERGGQPLAATLRPIAAIATAGAAAPQPLRHGAAATQRVPSRMLTVSGDEPAAVRDAASPPAAVPTVATAVTARAAPGAMAASTPVRTDTAAGVDADGLRSYRISLAVLAQRLRRYPPRAREAGWAGTAEVRVAVNAEGLAQAPQLDRSSGFAVIDEAALDMLGRAAQRTAVPDTLRGRAFSTVLPVEFKLTDD